MNYYGLTKEEYISLLKELGMCTKKWTVAKMKAFNERRLEIINKRSKKVSFKKLFKKKINRIRKRGK